MTSDTPGAPAQHIRCTFLVLRGVDPLFARTVHLVDVPRVGERIHMWFEGAPSIRGTVRDVQWTVPQAGPPTVNVQIELSAGDRKRFARRTPLARHDDLA
jgi:hypothetical protein